MAVLFWEVGTAFVFLIFQFCKNWKGEVTMGGSHLLHTAGL